MNFWHGTLVLMMVTIGVPAAAQQQRQPLEYIESSSPIPGGGVVSSVYVPGRGGPVYRGGPVNQSTFQAVREASLRQPATENNPSANSAAGQSVLDPSLGQTGVNTAQPYNLPSANPAPVPGQTPFQVPGAVQQSPVMTYQVPVAAQIPNLGVPTSWNRSIRTNNCAGYGPGAGHVPYGTVRAPATVYPSAAAVAPSLVPTAQPVAGTQQATLFRVQNFPPQAYAGKGIIGSPRVYHDGQPIRNLMRYLTW